NAKLTLNAYTDYNFMDKFIKYIDLSECTDGDYSLIGKYIGQYMTDGECVIDGLIFDNVDLIPENPDKDKLEQMVISALRREDDLQILPSVKPIPFDKMMIAVRCKDFPEYLHGKSLQAEIIEI
ncbi:MAG: hypothetical protein NC548_59380, partial [Lachnospiraceae bacterium]|nr:hypothetical protein [Lachnospiraceae bacterium]